MPPIGKCPTFSYHGSKCTIAKWIIDQIPKNKSYDYFIDLFGGRGNVTFRLLTTPGFIFNHFIINDPYTSEWFNTLIKYNGNFDFVPDIVNYDVYDTWKNAEPSVERILIEPIVCYHGNRFNIQGSAINDPENTTQYYSTNYKKNWTRKLQLAQSLLRNNKVKITNLDWKNALETLPISPQTFIYCDPPYFEKYNEKKTYPSINHDEFLDIISKTPAICAVSNYYNELYDSKLVGWLKNSKTRVSLSKGRQLGHANGRTEKIEYLWKNYDSTMS